MTLKWDPYDQYRLDRLATYNSEVARGILHNPVWRNKMRLEQTAFNEWQREDAKARGCIIVV